MRDDLFGCGWGFFGFDGGCMNVGRGGFGWFGNNNMDG